MIPHGEIHRHVVDTKNQAFHVLKKKSSDFSEEKEGFRFFQHNVFLFLRCLNMLLLFTPFLLLLHFWGSQFLTRGNTIFLLGVIYFALFSSWARYYVFHRINSYLLIPGENLSIFSSGGIFTLNRESIPFDKIGISDIHRTGMLSHIFNFGDIFLSSIITAREGTVPKIVLRQIRQPGVVLKKIQSMTAGDSAKK